MSLKPEFRSPRRSAHSVLRRTLLFGAGALLAASGFLAGCDKGGEKGTVLAQVGNATLTLEELRESFPAEYEQLIRREQYLDFIKRWIDDEVLYQQAVKGRLDDDPQVKRKLDKLMRKLLIEEFLARENPAEAFEPDEMAMNQYYEMHKEDFRRKVPEIKYTHIRVATAKQAADLRWKVQTDNNFLAQAATHSLDPVPEAITSIPFKKETELPPCLAQETAEARIGANTAAITCPDGVYLVRIFDRQEAGSLIPFPEAKEEISATLLMQRKDKLLEGRIAQYKEGLAINYNLDQIPGLTESPEMAATPSDAPAAGSAGQAASGKPAAYRPEEVEAHQVAPRPKPRKQPRPATATATPENQPAPVPADPAAAGTPQEENANVPKPETSP